MAKVKITGAIKAINQPNERLSGRRVQHHHTSPEEWARQKDTGERVTERYTKRALEMEEGATSQEVQVA